jgi:short-subunit dehydrogenase
MKMPAAPVVKAGLDGLDRNKAIVIPGMKNKLGAQASRFLPRSTMRGIIGRIKV